MGMRFIESWGWLEVAWREQECGRMKGWLAGHVELCAWLWRFRAAGLLFVALLTGSFVGFVLIFQ